MPGVHWMTRCMKAKVRSDPVCVLRERYLLPVTTLAPPLDPVVTGRMLAGPCRFEYST